MAFWRSYSQRRAGASALVEQSSSGGQVVPVRCDAGPGYGLRRHLPAAQWPSRLGLCAPPVRRTAVTDS